MNTRFVTAAALALSATLASLAAPSGAGAQNAAPAGTPTPFAVPGLPAGTNLDGTIRQIINAIGPFAGSAIANRLNSNVGTVSYYKGFEMQINVGGNRYENVHLKHGTTIDPRGETIRLGDTVDVGGVKESDGSLDANAITIRH